MAESIPDRWLQGACLMRERAGMSPRDALGAAVAEWQEQSRLAAETVPIDTVTLEIHPFDGLEPWEVLAAMRTAGKTIEAWKRTYGNLPARGISNQWVNPALGACLETAWGW